MRAFRYVLQPALDRAATLETDAVAALWQAQRTLALEEEAIAALDVQATHHRQRLNAQRAASAAVFAHLDALLAYAAMRRSVHLERSIAFTANVERAREHVATCAARRLALERHRDRRRSEHEAQAELQEEASIDEANALARIAL